MVAAKLFALKFGHQAVKTLVGCYGRSMDFIAFKQTLAWSILARQHDHPVLLIPAGVKRDGVQGEVCVGYLLSGMLMIIAVLVEHNRSAFCDLHLDYDKPILCANFTQVAGNGIHHPKASRLFCQVLGAVRQQVPATDPVIRSSSSESRHGETV